LFADGKFGSPDVLQLNEVARPVPRSVFALVRERK